MRATVVSGPLTFDHVAPPSVLRKTPPELQAQITAGSLGARTTILTAPPVGPDELQPPKDDDAMRRKEKRKEADFMRSSAPARNLIMKMWRVATAGQRRDLECDLCSCLGTKADTS